MTFYRDLLYLSKFPLQSSTFPRRMKMEDLLAHGGGGGGEGGGVQERRSEGKLGFLSLD